MKVGLGFDNSGALGCVDDNAVAIPNCAGAGVLTGVSTGGAAAVTITLTPTAPAAAGGNITWVCAPTAGVGATDVSKICS